MFKHRYLALVVLGWLAAGCANDQDTGFSTESVPQPVSAVKPAGDKAVDVPMGTGLKRLADLARADLQQRTGTATDLMTVVKADFVTWRDSSVGCPEPGNQYMQVLTPGARIHLQVDGKVYRYHSGGNKAPFLCESPSGVEPLPYAHGET